MLPDLIAEKLTVIFCGINPGLKSAEEGHHFSGRSNRFWKVLHQAGFTPHEIAPINDKTIVSFGYGLTTAVARATNRADELKKEEFANAIEAFKTKMTLYNPKYIAFLLFSQIHPPSIMQSDMLPLSMIKGCINIIRLAGRSGCILRWI